MEAKAIGCLPACCYSLYSARLLFSSATVISSHTTSVPNSSSSQLNSIFLSQHSSCRTRGISTAKVGPTRQFYFFFLFFPPASACRSPSRCSGGPGDRHRQSGAWAQGGIGGGGAQHGAGWRRSWPARRGSHSARRPRQRGAHLPELANGRAWLPRRSSTSSPRFSSRRRTWVRKRAFAGRRCCGISRGGQARLPAAGGAPPRAAAVAGSQRRRDMAAAHTLQNTGAMASAPPPFLSLPLSLFWFRAGGR